MSGCEKIVGIRGYCCNLPQRLTKFMDVMRSFRRETSLLLLLQQQYAQVGNSTAVSADLEMTSEISQQELLEILLLVNVNWYMLVLKDKRPKTGMFWFMENSCIFYHKVNHFMQNFLSSIFSNYGYVQPIKMSFRLCAWLIVGDFG